MKKWMVIAIAMVLAGCNDVSVEGNVGEEGANEECAKNEDCANNEYKHYCTGEHVCVQCVQDEVCDGNCKEIKCEAKPNPVDLSCSDNCEEQNQYCDMNKKECVDCLSNSHCNEGEQCIENTCMKNEIKIECEKNEDCADNKICQNEKCVEPEPVPGPNCSKLEPVCKKFEEDEHYTLYMQCNDNTDIIESVGCECEGPESVQCKTQEACQTGYVTQCSDNKIIMGCKDNLVEGQLSEYTDLFDCGELFCIGEEEDYAQCVECIDGDLMHGCGDNQLCINNKCENESNYDVVCENGEYLTITRNNEEISRVNCSKGCSQDNTGKAFCVEHEEVLCTEYAFQCNEEKTGVDLVCTNNTEIKKEIFECAEKKVCDEKLNECVPKPFVPYDCEKDTEKVKQEILETLNELGAYDYEMYNKCLEHVVTKDDVSKYDGGNDCVVLCGENIKANEFRNKSKSNNMIYIGINNATITNNGDAMSEPLIESNLNNFKMANVKLDFDLKLSNKARGMIANKCDDKCLISNVTVKDRKIQLDSGDDFTGIGTLLGDAMKTTFKNVNLENVIISLNNNSHVHENVGGVSGYAENVVVISPLIKELSIVGENNNIDYMKSVGGLFGKAKNISIYGGDDGYVNIKQISNSERDVGGLVGHLEEKFEVNSLRIKIDSIDVHFPCAGGIIGYATGRKNDAMLIENVDLTIDKITAGFYVGGMIGIQDGSSGFKIRNSKIVTNSLYGANHCGGDDECDGSYVGGLVGNLRTNSSLDVNGVINEFNIIKSDSNFAGGILGGIKNTGSVTINDVINRNLDPNSKISAKEFAGGLIGAAGHDKDNKVDKLIINNVINEVNYIESMSNSAGGIGFVVTNKDGNENVVSIKNIISNTRVKSSGSGGLVGTVHFRKYNSVSISEVLTKSKFDTDGAGGLINTIGRLKDSDGLYPFEIANYFFNYNGNENYVNISKALVDNVLNDKDVMTYNNVVSKISQLNVDACPPTTTTSYLEKNDSAKQNDYKSIMLSVFDRVYYHTPGMKIGDSTDIHDLLWCGDKNSTNARKQNTDEGLQCSYHRDYQYPISGCWFTDFIYCKECNENMDVYDNINNGMLDSSDIPIKPYSSSSRVMRPKNGDYSDGNRIIVIDDDVPESENNNINLVLDELNGDWSIDNGKTRWVECSSINKSVIDSDNYPNLLCPVLSGKFTCLGTFKNEDGTFDPNGNCDSI